MKLTRRQKFEKWRNIVGFWILGLCNNFPYVVMLSAAFDILRQLQGEGKPDVVNATNVTPIINHTDLPLFNYSGNSSALGRDCNKASTSVSSPLLLLLLLYVLYLHDG